MTEYNEMERLSCELMEHTGVDVQGSSKFILALHGRSGGCSGLRIYRHGDVF